METIEHRVIRILAEQSSHDPVEITRATRLLTDLHFESLDQVETIMKLEDEFEVTIYDETAEAIPADQLTVGRIIDCLSSDPGGNAGVHAKLPPRPTAPNNEHASPANDDPDTFNKPSEM